MGFKLKRLPSTPITTVIEKFSHDGRGIARINGKTTFIQGALPGEIVVFRYTRVKRDYDEGQVLSLITAAPNRSLPRCRHYQVCGGCTLQHLDEKDQIEVKQALLLDSLQRIGHVMPEQILPPITASSWNYRDKARLSVQYRGKDKVAFIGFREKYNPAQVVALTQCPILSARIEALLPTLTNLVNSLETSMAIAQIEVAAGAHASAFIFRHLAPLTAVDQQKLRQFGKQNALIIFLQSAGPTSITLLYSPNARPFLDYLVKDLALNFRFHPQDFTQVNPEINQLMIKRALALMALTADDIVLDLFCGLGNFSLPLAKFCRKVIGLEGDKAMIERAAHNSQANHLNNTEFYSVNLDHEDALRPFLKRHITKILLDPPRTGALKILNQLQAINPLKIVYVSCNPATLARDSDILVNQHRYRLVSAGVLDMFPHTAHVESIALFERG